MFTLLTALIDYRGYRLCAQGIIPGILQKESTATVVYGSIDNGKKIAANPEFHQLLSEVSKVTHMKENTILEEDGTAVKLYTPLECKVCWLATD